MLVSLIPAIASGGLAGLFIGKYLKYKAKYQTTLQTARNVAEELLREKDQCLKLTAALNDYRGAYDELASVKQASYDWGDAAVPDFSIDGRTGKMHVNPNPGPHVIQEEI